MSSVLRHNTQQTFFLHSSHSQYTQFHFRCSGLKIVSSDSRTQKYGSVFRTWKFWVQFSGLKIWGRDLEKIKEKNQKKFQSSRNVQRHSQVSKRVLGQFFLPSVPVVHGVIESFRKKFKENSKLQKSPELLPKLSTRVLNMLWGDFSEFFLPSVRCRAFQFFWT